MRRRRRRGKAQRICTEVLYARTYSTNALDFSLSKAPKNAACFLSIASRLQIIVPRGQPVNYFFDPRFFAEIVDKEDVFTLIAVEELEGNVNIALLRQTCNDLYLGQSVRPAPGDRTQRNRRVSGFHP